MKTTALFTLSLVALLCMTTAGAGEAGAARTLAATVAAGNLHKVSLSANVGEVHVKPSTDGAVHIAVRIKPREHGYWFVKWTDDGAAADMKQAKLNKAIHDGTLGISLSIPNAEDNDNKRFEEKWTITMPAALALKTDTQVGDVRIEGIAGGVDTETHVGEVHIRVPGGSVRAHVNVGELDVATGASAYKTLELDSSIGDIGIHGLNVNGGERGHSLGRHVSLKGNGTDAFDLAVNVGEVNLTFGEQP